MGKKLVIVESPAKARTIGQYLGGEFDVRSSYGHVRDLPKKGMSVDIEKNFEPTYEVAPEKRKVIKELKQALKTADSLWLATDEDREGEAIAWHLSYALGVKPEDAKRIVFHEITKSAIEEAIKQPRQINAKLVDAQQARRILDRLVGYELSPVLWKKIQTGLSAGRVQSVAVRLIVDREREIGNFKPISSFKVSAELAAEGETLKAELSQVFKTETEARDFLEAAKSSRFSVKELVTKPSTKSAPKPLTTSTLQQTAARLLGFSVKQTMVLAQRLYEAGHITYMRTDSMNLSSQALDQAAQIIRQRFGDEYYEHRTYRATSRLAQEAHEAIRPTDFAKQEVEGEKGQSRLYNLIWRRSLASQMAHAKTEQSLVTIAISERPETLRAAGEVLKFDGYLKAYHLELKMEDTILPPLETGQVLELQKMRALETISRPKPRYTEATLVKKLESLDIGRPSTYAPTISTIQDRGYVQKGDHAGEVKQVKSLTLEGGSIKQTTETQLLGADRNKLAPTQTGEVVTDFLVKNFPDIVDYQFTANVEEDFDAIAQGQKDWRGMLSKFYERFHPTLKASEKITRQEATKMRELGKDPVSGLPVFARLGRYGAIIQLGETEAEDKPKFAPIPEALKIDTISLAEALKLLELPRSLGQTDDGDEIMANHGPYGPYLRAGSTTVSIKDKDPFIIEAAEAKQLIDEKRQTEANKLIQEFKGSGLQILNGPYGPYITDGKRNAPVPKGDDPEKLTLEVAQQLLDKGARGRRRQGRSRGRR